jgi:DNA-binding Xre family transcriptional regulator
MINFEGNEIWDKSKILKLVVNLVTETSSWLNKSYLDEDDRIKAPNINEICRYIISSSEHPEEYSTIGMLCTALNCKVEDLIGGSSELIKIAIKQGYLTMHTSIVPEGVIDSSIYGSFIKPKETKSEVCKGTVTRIDDERFFPMPVHGIDSFGGVYIEE